MSVPDQVIAIVAEIKDVEASGLSAATPLHSEDGASPSLGFDSLDAFELAMALEERFGLDLTENVDLTSLRTVGDVTDYVMAHAPLSR